MDYFPPSELEGGWRTADEMQRRQLGVDESRLRAAIAYHEQDAVFTQRYGGALIIVYKGFVIGESYVTGTVGGPQPWTAQTCNDMKSSTKSVFGTAVSRFLHDYQDQVSLDSLLVGTSPDNSLIPQIWERPLTDPRKTKIKIKHALSMTSGHDSREPWLAPSSRHHYPGYDGPFQMHEYCFGWWHFDGIPSQHRLLFDPGHRFNYSNYGLELLALAMRNLTGEEVGPYVYDRVLRHIGMPIGIRDNQYRMMPYADDRELNFAEEPGWGRGGSDGCNAYGADGSHSPYGTNSIVGSTFRCTARDFARLGYLWLKNGRWNDQQLIPADWMAQATRRFVQADGTTPVNYGYTFWLQDEWEGVPSDTFMSRGHNLNDCTVIPSLDLVIVRQGNESGTRETAAAFVQGLIRRVITAVLAQSARQ
ncbi:MAG: serine hydrolase domain-containing protein [Chloroflexota bacterium]